MGRKSKVTVELIETAKELIEAGFSHKQTYNAIGISHKTFYENSELIATIKKAELDLRNKVSKALMDTAVGGDTTALIFLAKRLNLFSTSVNIEIKDTKSALEGLSELINTNIPLEQKNSLKGIIDSYIKGYEIVNLEDRIVSLEKALNEK